MEKIIPQKNHIMSEFQLFVELNPRQETPRQETPRQETPRRDTAIRLGIGFEFSVHCFLTSEV